MSFLSGVVFVSVTSLRLTYQDLELQRKRDEEKLRGLEGKKKEQAERLGMGFSNRRWDFNSCSHLRIWYRFSLVCSGQQTINGNYQPRCWFSRALLPVDAYCISCSQFRIQLWLINNGLKKTCLNRLSQWFACYEELNSDTCVFMPSLTFFPRSSGVSHSVMADMQTIQQDTPALAQSSSRPRKYSENDDEDEEGYFFIRCDPSHSWF